VELSGRSRRAGREREHTESRRLKKAVPLALVAAPVTYLPAKGVVEAVAAARRAKNMAERIISAHRRQATHSARPEISCS